jgi:hypothetical protein
MKCKLLYCDLNAILCLALIMSGSAIAQSWNFDKNVPKWAKTVITEPGSSGSNQVLRIDAKRPHHTRVNISDKVSSSFVFESRIRLHKSAGAEPAAYLYAITPNGFIALTAGSGRARLFNWCGNKMPSQGMGQVKIPAFNGEWLRVKMAMESGTITAKVWPDGTREPSWSMSGQLEDTTIKNIAVGVWLPPGKSATASMLFDDMSLRPVTSNDRVAAFAAPAAPLQVPADMLTGIFESGPHIGVVASGLAAALNRENGSLRHLYNIKESRSFTNPDQRRPLFRINLTRWQLGESADITSDDFSYLRWKKISQSSVQAEFSDGPEPGMVVTCRVNAGKDGLVHFGIVVKNPSQRAVASIRYPCFASPATLGDDAVDDRLLFPQSHTDGIVINAPGSRNRGLHGAYPGSAAVQMMALYDSTAGLMLATQDAEGHCKKFDVEMVANRFVEFKVTHLRPELPGDGGTPYDTVMGSFIGDWRDAADLYKRWACQQPWCARKLPQRDDVPAFLKEGCAGVIFGIGSSKGYNGSFGPNLELLPGIVDEYRKRAGVPHMLVMPYGWENRGTWAGINYFPACPSDEAWRSANAALRAQGDRTVFLTSGYWWVVRRPQTSNGPAFDDTAQFERQKAMVIQRADGTPWLVDNTDKVGSSGDWRGLSAKLCHGSVDARRVMRDIFLRAAQIGSPLVSFDQEIGGGQSAPCYASDHGHPPGYGSWMWSEFRDLCEEIRREGRKVQPEIGLFVENCGEMIIPVMATYWSRQFGVLDHGSSGEGPIGLFSYLYHEYVTAIGAAMVQGQGPSGARVSPGLRCQALAHNVTRGLIPCPFAHQVPLKAKDKWTEQVSKAYFIFCRPFAAFPEYLLLGETLHPPQLRCKEREEWFIPRRRKSESKEGEPEKRITRPLSSVVAGRFKAPDGTTGSVIVNATPQPQLVRVKDPGRGRPAKLYRVDKSVEQSFDSLPEELVLELEPFGVRMLIVE